MAKSQIGAIIGVEGAAEYRRQINDCVVATKNLASATKLVEASFSGQTKTIADLARQKTALKGEIVGVQNKLALQRAELSKVVEAYNKGDENALKYKNAMIQLATETNKTETELYELEQKLRDLPADSFIGKLELIKENLENNQSEMKKWGDLLTDVGTKLTIGFTVPITTAATASVKAAMDYESAFTGVIKTLDLSMYSADEASQKLNEVSDGIKNLALNTASSSTEIAAVAEIAGQLGISADNIVEFTKVMVELGDTTNLSAEDAATALARVLNITQEVEKNGVESYEKVGSAVVHLGNNFATSESEIVAMANRLAAGGTLAGLTTQEILGLSAAMSSVGITAEAGGTAMNQTLTKIESEFAAFSQGAESNFGRIAEIAGMSADAFADAWKNRPAEAIEAFISGLGSLDEKGESATLVLDELGMAGIRQSNMLKSLGLASNVLADAMDKANEGYEEGIYLSKEAELRYGTFETQIKQFGEAVRQLGIAFGGVLLPMIQPVVEKLTEWLTSFSKMDEGTKKFIITIAGLLAALGPVLAMIGTGLQLFSNLSVVATTLGTTVGALGLGMLKWVAIGALVVAAITLIVKAIQWFREHSEDILRFWEGVKLGFEAIVETIKFLWELACNVIAERWQQFKEDLKQKVDEIKEKMINGFQTAKDKVISTVTDLKDRIKSTFTNLVSSALSWGRDLMSNLISGITSKISSLVNSVKNVASTIWSYLHFSEPEKGPLSNFTSWMPDMMKGLAQGIYDNMYLVDNAVDNLAGHMGIGTSYNYGGVVINLNVPQGANGQQLVDEIERELTNRTIRRKAVFA